MGRRNRSGSNKKNHPRYDEELKGTRRKPLPSEAPFFEALRDMRDAPPYWFVSVRQSTNEEDARKIDAVVVTIVSEWIIYVQLKSNEKAAEGFRLWHARECAKEEKSAVHPHIITIVANKRKDPEEIRKDFFKLAGEKFKHWERTRKKE